MTHPREPEPLRPMLHATESQLADRLDEACSHDVLSETTAELVRLEETLSEAARVAKQAVSLRRRLRTGHGSGGPDAAEGSDERPAERDAAVQRADRRSTQPDDRADPPDGEESV